MKQPECLHIPTLYEDESAQISWGLVEENTNHIIERIINDTFLQALSGYSWSNIASINDPWSKYDQEALNWQQIETRTSKGQIWERLDYNGFDWAEIEKQANTWQQLECQDTNFEIFRGSGTDCSSFEVGSTWLEIDSLNNNWSDLEAKLYSWDNWERMTVLGLSWDSIEAKWLSFAEWQKKGLTFQELDTQSIEEHRGMTDFIPIGSDNAMYRIKAYNSDGDASDYLTTTQLPVIPIFYRKGFMKYPVKAGNRYLILLKAQDVYDLNRVKMNLHYNQQLLELVNFAAQSTGTVIKPGDYPNDQVTIYSHLGGKLWFQSTRTVRQDECFSGLLTLTEFIARETGIATISLS
ncbi:MAG: hypothetical protein ACRDBO_21020 [Lachnospiraceae bacterium]